MGSPAHGSARARQGQNVHLVVDAIPTLLWSAHPNGSADFVNQRWLEYAGLSLDCGWNVAVHPDDFSNMLAAFHEAVNSGKENTNKKPQNTSSMRVVPRGLIADGHDCDYVCRVNCSLCR